MRAHAVLIALSLRTRMRPRRTATSSSAAIESKLGRAPTTSDPAPTSGAAGSTKSTAAPTTSGQARIDGWPQGQLEHGSSTGEDALPPSRAPVVEVADDHDDR